MSKNQYLILSALIAVLILAGVAYGGYYSWKNQKNNNSGGLDVLCPGEVKTCSDGSSVHRVAPNCEFAKCPAEVSIPSGDINQRACTMEAKLCPDGSAVGRSGPNCEFAPCPGESQK